MSLTLAGATALSAGMNFLGGLMSNEQTAQYNAEEAQKNRDFQERMYNQQVQDNINFWKMQNEYNMPSAVFERQLNGMKQNNLNPLLMYGEGGISSIGTASQAPESAKAPSGSQASAHFNNPIDMANLAMLESQKANLDANTQKTKAEAELTGEMSFGQQIQNWISEQTKNISVLLAHGNYDLARSLIRKNDNEIFQSSFMNAETANTMILNRLYLMRNYDLHAWELGERFKIEWENVASGRIQANAAWKNSISNMMNAVTNRNLSSAQIGYMATQTALNRQLYSFNQQNNPLLLRQVRIMNEKFKSEITKTQQDAVNMFLKNQYQFMNNSYYKEYGIDQIPQGYLSKEIMPLGNMLNNVTGTWSPYGSGFDEVQNMFCVPINF